MYEAEVFAMFGSQQEKYARVFRVHLDGVKLAIAPYLEKHQEYCERYGDVKQTVSYIETQFELAVLRHIEKMSRTIMHGQRGVEISEYYFLTAMLPQAMYRGYADMQRKLTCRDKYAPKQGYAAKEELRETKDAAAQWLGFRRVRQEP